jgi:hypothetical protein
LRNSEAKDVCETLNLKVPFGTAKMVRVTGAKYLAWEDAFEVDFEDGLTFPEPHATIRKANKISGRAAAEHKNVISLGFGHVVRVLSFINSMGQEAFLRNQTRAIATRTFDLSAVNLRRLNLFERSVKCGVKKS